METEFTNLEKQIVSCKKCPRLTAWREEVAEKKRRAYLEFNYWGKPVPGFGDHKAKVLVIGLAPGAHGSNRTGRMFTGDSSGDFLYRFLYEHGFANQPGSVHRTDGLKLSNIFISAVCRCVPPGNKPCLDEITNCLSYLSRELELLSDLQGVVTLGRIAYESFRKLVAVEGADLPENVFTHGRLQTTSYHNLWILQSYHPSRQNTQTGRLTEEMFSGIWGTVNSLII